jgi:hypothetical protein
MLRYYASKGKQTHQQRVAEETAITHKITSNIIFLQQKIVLEGRERVRCRKVGEKFV